MAVVLGTLTAGVDTLRGGAGDEIVIVPSNNANLAGTDIIAMGGGIDTLRFDRALDVSIAPARLAGISGVDVFGVECRRVQDRTLSS